MRRLLIQHTGEVGVFSDAHNRIGAIERLVAKHAHITSWLSLGDVFDLKQPQLSLQNLPRWQKLGIPTLVGNHELDLLNTPEFIDAKWILELPRYAEIVTPQGLYLAYHSKPNDPWSFVNKGFTEREYVDTYPAEGELGTLIGHNHTQHRFEFQSEDAVLFSIGALFLGQYAIIGPNGVSLLNDPSLVSPDGL